MKIVNPARRGSIRDRPVVVVIVPIKILDSPSFENFRFSLTLRVFKNCVLLRVRLTFVRFFFSFFFCFVFHAPLTFRNIRHHNTRVITLCHDVRSAFVSSALFPPKMVVLRVRFYSLSLSRQRVTAYHILNIPDCTPPSIHIHISRLCFHPKVSYSLNAAITTFK